MTKIKICPRCKKPKLKSATNVSGWLAPNMYECTACDYIGYFYLEVDVEDLNFDENIKKGNNNKEV